MLCRACGEEMIASKYCSDCNEVIQSRCGSCKKEDEMSMHCHNSNNSNNNRHQKNHNMFSVGQYVVIVSNLAFLLNLA